MKRFLATIGLLTLLALPASMANAACCNSCCAPACNSCCAPSCDPCGCSCQIQCVTLPKRHFWNLKRTGYYTICPCMTGGAAPVCPCKLDECCACGGPTKTVIIPKRHFWEKDRCQQMPLANCCSPCGCAAPCCPAPCCDPCCKK